MKVKAVKKYTVLFTTWKNFTCQCCFYFCIGISIWICRMKKNHMRNGLVFHCVKLYLKLVTATLPCQNFPIKHTPETPKHCTCCTETVNSASNRTSAWRGKIINFPVQTRRGKWLLNLVRGKINGWASAFKPAAPVLLWSLPGYFCGVSQTIYILFSQFFFCAHPYSTTVGLWSEQQAVVVPGCCETRPLQGSSSCSGALESKYPWHSSCSALIFFDICCIG